MYTNRPNWDLSLQQQIFVNCLFGLVALSAIAYAVYVARQEKTRYPYFLALGAALLVFYEPFNNVLALCTYPEINQITWIEALGRKIPMYIGFCYVFYFTAPMLWIIRRLEAGVTEAQWWKYYGVGFVLVTTFELIPIHFGWWRYYGEHQALVVLGFPSWWWFVNAQSVFVGATLVYSLRKNGILSEGRSFLLIPILPMALWSAHGSAAVPTFAALNSTTDLRVTTVASLLSMLLALMNMWICGRLVTRSAVSQRADSASIVENVRRAASA